MRLVVAVVVAVVVQDLLYETHGESFPIVLVRSPQLAAES